MPLKLKCRCGEKLSAPESAAGKKGKCPKCGMKFVIPGGPAVGTAAAAPATTSSGAEPLTTATRRPAAPADPFGLDLPELGTRGQLDDLFDESFDASMAAATTTPEANPFASPQTVAQPKKRGSTRAGMNRVANGIKLVFWGSVMIVGSIFVAMFGGTAAVFVGPELLLVVLAGVYFIQLAGGILSLIGRLLCLAVPPQVGGKGLIVAAVALDAVAFGGGVMAGIGTIEEDVANLIGAIAGFATFILFVLFVRKVALFLKQKHLVDDAKLVLVLLVAIFPGGLAAALIPCLGVVALIGLLIYFMVKYLNLLQHTAEAARC